MRSKRALNTCIIILCAIPLFAQDTLQFYSEPSPDFIREEANIIQGNELLHPLFERLYELKNGRTGIVNILHIGDSHIQADFLTGITRKRLQQQFGNAGLGLSFPGRAARTNESPEIYSTAKGEWEINKITYSQNKEGIGIGGMAMKTSLIGNSIKIKAHSSQYAFDRITLFFEKDKNSCNINVKDSTGQILAIAGPFTDEPFTNASRLNMPYAIKQVQLETSQFTPSEKELSFYGISLEKNQPGLRYHIIGVNGARYRHYLSSRELLRQTAVLNPHLIIISLGTNEASDHPAVDPKLDIQIQTLVTELKRINPASVILLTTPADYFKKRTRRNPGLHIVRKKIIDAAKNQHLPYWDLYEVAGGNQAADRWKKADFFQTDGIHYTQKGYELQGKLLYEAIMKGYNTYVLHRFAETH